MKYEPIGISRRLTVKKDRLFEDDPVGWYIEVMGTCPEGLLLPKESECELYITLDGTTQQRTLVFTGVQEITVPIKGYKNFKIKLLWQEKN